MATTAEFVLLVHTGKIKDAGTKNTVHLKLHCTDGKVSKQITLNSFFSDDFCRGQVDVFHFSGEQLGILDSTVKIERLELWKDSTLGFISDDWFVDKIVVENSVTHLYFHFPVFRWIKSGSHYQIQYLDTSLPQFDDFSEQRKKELEEKRKTYKFHQRFPNAPAQVKELPPDEEFIFKSSFDIIKKTAALKLTSQVFMVLSGKWRSLEDIKNIYDNRTFMVPSTLDNWDTDIKFGRQRIASLNSNLIRLVKTIPDKFPVTDDILGSLLEGLSLEDAIAQKKLFITDLHILEDIPSKHIICQPIGLFYVNKNKKLLPVAIQLFQKPGRENPIFTPLDPPMTWKIVKMWYNSADAQHHQSVSHLGLTHVVMEGFDVTTQRNLSPSHPVFKLLAPHFLYLITINWIGLEALIQDGGFADSAMSVGSKGMKALIVKAFHEWRLDVNGLLPEDLKARGLDDPDVLPDFHVRDDSLLMFNAINNYVKSYVSLYYPTPETLKEDSEIQAWAKELVKELHFGGPGYKGIPGNGAITCTDDLVKTVTSIIYTCSVVHAAVNFPQYDEYAFPPNFPALMKGKPPTSKDAKVTDQDLLDSLGNKNEIFDALMITTVLSEKASKSLGDFEVQYIFDPKALPIVEKFREDLKDIGKKIRDRNSRLHHPYEHLDPKNIPNSISI